MAKRPVEESAKQKDEKIARLEEVIEAQLKTNAQLARELMKREEPVSIEVKVLGEFSAGTFLTALDQLVERFEYVPNRELIRMLHSKADFMEFRGCPPVEGVYRG